MNDRVLHSLLPVLAGFVLAVIVYALRKRANRRSLDAAQRNKPSVMTHDEAATLVHQLDELDYFAYAAPQDIIFLRENLEQSLEEHGILDTTWHPDPPFSPLDLRLYYLDGETLFEQGGFAAYLKDFQPLFDQLGIKMDFHVEVEAFSEDKAMDYEVSLNNSRYVIFRKFKGDGWGEAAAHFANMVNDQLALQQSKERLYLVRGGNDGQCVFLTDAQFALLDASLPPLEEKPRNTDEWCRFFKVEL